MKKPIRLLCGFVWGRYWAQGFFNKLHLFSLKGLNFGGGTNPKDSGEEYAVVYAITRLGSKDLKIFDVGGNKGDYTRMWLNLAEKYKREIKVFVFEPSSYALGILHRVFLGNNKVQIVESAVAEQSGDAVLYTDEPGSGLGSLSKRDLQHINIKLESQEKVQVCCLDDFCSKQGIEKIDFLKLDVEGFELSALKGASGLIEKNKINFIQFEFGGTDIDTKVFFKDFYNLLNKKYKIYRILKKGLWPIQTYSELDEVFLTTNYLAELKNNA
ncbi:MAG: FkbM family methyltransferase [Patescibacteria group bacterium]|nr:FkbM family methyltransferase [Patescibacteria group bacterium]